MLIYAVFLLSIAIGTTGGALVSGPTDQNVTVGQQVILLCATDLDLPVFWYFKGHEIFYGGKVAMSFQDRFNVSSKNKGEYNLVIPSADVSYNGEYICGDDEGEGQRKSALLYVTADTVTVAETQGTTSSGDVNLGPIIGIVIGIVLFLAIVIGLVFYCCKKCASKKEKKPSVNAEAGEKLLDKDSGAAKAVTIKSDRNPTPKGSGAKEVTANSNIEETPNLKDSGAKEVTANSNIEETPNLKDSGATEAANSNIYGTPDRTVPGPAAGNKGVPKWNEDPAPAASSKDVPKWNEGSGAAKAVTIKIDRTPTPKDSGAKEVTANSNIEETPNLKAGDGKKRFNQGTNEHLLFGYIKPTTKSGPQNSDATKGNGREDNVSQLHGQTSTSLATGSIAAGENPGVDSNEADYYAAGAEQNAPNTAPSSVSTAITEDSGVDVRKVGSLAVDTKQSASSTIPTNGFKAEASSSAGENESNTASNTANDSKGTDENSTAYSSEMVCPGGGTEQNASHPTAPLLSNPRDEPQETASSIKREDQRTFPRDEKPQPLPKPRKTNHTVDPVIKGN